MTVPEGWAISTVGDLCVRVTSGGTPSRANPSFFVDGTVPWVKTGELRDSYIFDTDEQITEAAIQQSSAKKLPVGTVLMAMYGATVGALAFLGREAACNQACCAMIANPAVCDSRWLFYTLLNDRTRIVSLATGAAQQNLSGKSIREFSYIVPPVEEQRGIAEVLGALDDKIAANAALVTTADDLLRATYASLVDDEVPLSDLAEFINGRAFTKGATGTGRVVVRIAELNSGIGGSTVYNDIDVAERHLARPGDLLFAWSGSLTVHRWFRPEAIVNQHIFKVVPREVPMWVVKGALDRKLEDFRAIAADKATTMGHIQRRHLDESVAIPSREQIARHDPSMTAVWNRALSAEQESLRLAQTRDALLPGLMSGKIRVKDAERAVEDVV